MTFNKVVYQTDVFSIRIIESNIFETRILSHATMNVKDVWEAKKINTLLSKGSPYAFLASQGEFSFVSNEAKKLLASESIIGNSVAKALLIQSLSDRIVANFYLKVSLPKVNTKAFTQREKAINWLRSQLLTPSKIA